jgi:ABC-type sugar transport system permease subunit
MNIQIRLIHVLLLTLIVSFSSCTVEKRLHFPGHTVRWNHANKVEHSEKEQVSEVLAETNSTKSDEKSITTVYINQPFTEEVNQLTETNLIPEKADNFIAKSNFDEKLERLNSIKNKVSESKFLKKKFNLKSKKSEVRPDNDMWGYLGSILVGALIVLAIVIVVALIVALILSTLPLVLAKIIGGILLAGLLLFFILY